MQLSWQILRLTHLFLWMHFLEIFFTVSHVFPFLIIKLVSILLHSVQVEGGKGGGVVGRVVGEVVGEVVGGVVGEVVGEVASGVVGGVVGGVTGEAFTVKVLDSFDAKSPPFSTSVPSTLMIYPPLP